MNFLSNKRPLEQDSEEIVIKKKARLNRYQRLYKACQEALDGELEELFFDPEGSENVRTNIRNIQTNLRNAKHAQATITFLNMYHLGNYLKQEVDQHSSFFPTDQETKQVCRKLRKDLQIDIQQWNAAIRIYSIFVDRLEALKLLREVCATDFAKIKQGEYEQLLFELRHPDEGSDLNILTDITNTVTE